MNEKILIMYACRSGSTAEVAEAIGKTLVESSAQVDLLPMQEVKDLSDYRAVVAGNAICKVREWIAPVRAQVRPVSEDLFAGKLDFSKMPFTTDQV